MNKKKMSSHAWYKIFVYVAMIVFAISIIVPVAWVFLSSVKSQLDLVGDPWSMPTQFLWSNFVDAMEKARMGEYFINSCWCWHCLHPMFWQDIRSRARSSSMPCLWQDCLSM